LKGISKGREKEEEDGTGHWMILGKREHIGTGK
jgi:hypothetical protein